MTTDEGPTQTEVDEMAAQMFGADWKATPDTMIAYWQGLVAKRRDRARTAVLEQQGES